MTDDLTLEQRARQAAAGVNHAVNSAELQLFAAGIPAVRTAPVSDPRRFGDRWMAAAGAFVAIIVIVGLAMLPGRLFAPDNNDVATPEVTLPDGMLVPIDEPSDRTAATDAVPIEDSSTTTTQVDDDPTTTVAVDVVAPELSITSPDDGVTVSDYLLQFRGKTEPGATVIAAGQWEADVDDAGNWEIILGLNSGSNIATFTAIDAAGNETNAQVTVIYDPPSPTTTTTKPGEGEEQGQDFTAFAQFETCEETPPFNVYWGTAPAGTKVSIG